VTDWSQFTPVNEPAPSGKVDWSKFTPVSAEPNAVLPWQSSMQNANGEVPLSFATRYTPAGLLPLAAGGGAGGLQALMGGENTAALAAAAEGGGDVSALSDAMDREAIAKDIGSEIPGSKPPASIADTMRNTAEGMSFEPQTTAGKNVAGPMDWLMEKISHGGKFLGDKTQDATGSPAAAATVDTLTNILPMLLAEKAGRGAVDIGRAAKSASSVGDMNIGTSIDADLGHHIDPIQAATSPTAADLSASEHISAGEPNPITAQSDQATASLSQMVNNAITQTPPAPNPVSPAAPPVQEGRAATPPPPALVDKLNEVTGGDPKAIADIIGKSADLKPGETPEGLAEQVKNGTTAPVAPDAAQPNRGANGPSVDTAASPISAPAAEPVAPRVAEGEVPGAPADRVASVPDSAFNGDLEHSLNSVFRGEDYDGKPVPLHNRGFTPDEISALQKAGLADADGKMSREQFDAWWNERGERLKPKSQRNTQSQPPAEKIAPQPVEPNVPQLDPQRMNELRQARDAGTITPEQHAELNQHLETALTTADVGGEHIPGLLNQVGRAQLEQSGKMKPFRAKTDIDDFKEVNDTLGHDVGDEVLKAKAQAMVDAFGPGNAWREGGDEFGAHADTPEELHAGMAKVRQAMKDLVIEGVDQKGNPVGELPTGVSYGIGKGDTPKLAAKAADNALYVDKATRTASGERRGRRATDAQEVGQGVGGGNEGQGRGEVPSREQAQVAVAEPPTKAAPEPPAKPVPEGQTEVSARNAAVDADRIARDLPEIPEAEREEWQKPYDEARAKIDANKNYPRELAAEVVKSKRPISATETMALTHDLRDLTQEHADATRAVLDAKEAGDRVAEVQARARLQAAQDALTLNHTAIRVGGREAARALSIRNAIVKKDYTIGRNMDRAKVSYGDRFGAEEKRAVEAHTEEIKRADETYERAVADAERKANANRKKTPDEVEQERLQKKMDDLQSKIEARLKACPI
jgi:diguanylate cyclase (GGDEF)-like protein